MSAVIAPGHRYLAMPSRRVLGNTSSDVPKFVRVSGFDHVARESLGGVDGGTNRMNPGSGVRLLTGFEGFLGQIQDQAAGVDIPFSGSNFQTSAFSPVTRSLFCYVVGMGGWPDRRENSVQ